MPAVALGGGGGAGPAGAPPLSVPRGPVSAALLEVLTGAVDGADALAMAVPAALAAPPTSWVADDDTQVALLCLYELHYRGSAGVDDRWEWHPELLAVRARLEAALETELRARVHVPDVVATDRASIATQLFRLADEDEAPSVARWISCKATLDEVRELLVLKSVYQLKEADPHTCPSTSTARRSASRRSSSLPVRGRRRTGPTARSGASTVPHTRAWSQPDGCTAGRGPTSTGAVPVIPSTRWWRCPGRSASARRRTG